MAESDVSSSTDRDSADPRSMLLLSVRDRIQLFAVFALALFVSFLGQLALAAVSRRYRCVCFWSP